MDRIPPIVSSSQEVSDEDIEDPGSPRAATSRDPHPGPLPPLPDLPPLPLNTHFNFSIAAKPASGTSLPRPALVVSGAESKDNNPYSILKR